MKKSENIALHYIMDCLNAGFTFGKDCVWDYYKNEPFPFPYFDRVLYITSQGNIGWRHFGSSANSKSLKSLYWIITVIFKLTPETFLEKYITDDKSELA